MITYTEIFHIYKPHISDFKWLEVKPSRTLWCPPEYKNLSLSLISC